MYQLINDEEGVLLCIRRLTDNASIPPVDDNRDYLDYLDWVAEGNTPEGC